MILKRNYFFFYLCLAFKLNGGSQTSADLFTLPPALLNNQVSDLDTFYFDQNYGVTYYDSLSRFLFSKTFYPNNQLRSYQLLIDVRFFGQYALDQLFLSEDGKILAFTITGPLFYEYYYSKDSLNNVTIYNIDSIGNGFGFVHDEHANLLSKVIFTTWEDSVIEYNYKGHIEKKFQKIFGINNVYLGSYVTFDNYGNIDTIGSYLSYAELDSIGVLFGDKPKSIKNGEWAYYDCGKLIKTEIWKMDTLIAVIEEKKSRR